MLHEDKNNSLPVERETVAGDKNEMRDGKPGESKPDAAELETKTPKAKKVRKKGWLRNRILATGVILLVGALVLNWIIGMMRGPAPVVVETQPVEKGTVEQMLNTSGILTTGEQVTLYSPVSAPISAAKVEAGQRVQAGDMMFEFDTVLLERNYRAASAAAGMSSLQVQQARDVSAEAEQSVADSQANIDNLYIQRDKAQNTLNSLLAQQQAAQQKAAALKKVWDDLKDSGGGEEALAAAEAAYNEALALADALQKQVTVAQADVQEQQAKLAAAQQTNAAAKAAVLNDNQNKSLGLQQVSPQTAFETARDSLNAAKAGVAAPISGVVTSVLVNEGSAASQYAPMCTIESTDNVDVVVSLSRYDLERVREGQAATVTTLGKQYEAEVAFIDAFATASVTGSSYVKATISLKKPDNYIRLGLEADVSIETGMARDVIKLPIMAVNTDVEGNHCFVLENGVAVRREVELGLGSDIDVEVRSGVQEGDVVILSSQGLHGGEAVTAGNLPDATDAFPFQMGGRN